MSRNNVLKKLLRYGFGKIDFLYNKGMSNITLKYKLDGNNKAFTVTIDDYQLFMDKGIQYNNLERCFNCLSFVTYTFNLKKTLLVTACNCAKAPFDSWIIDTKGINYFVNLQDSSVNILDLLPDYKKIFIMFIYKYSKLKQLPRCVMRHICEKYLFINQVEDQNDFC